MCKYALVCLVVVVGLVRMVLLYSVVCICVGCVRMVLMMMGVVV